MTALTTSAAFAATAFFPALTPFFAALATAILPMAFLILFFTLGAADFFLSRVGMGGLFTAV